MKTVTLEVENDKDLELLYLLVERLGIRVVDDTRSEEELAKAREVIDAGTDMTKEELAAFLEWHEADRADRPLPFRD